MKRRTYPTPDEKESYLKERGFEIVGGAPQESTELPYIRLTKQPTLPYDASSGEAERAMEYHVSQRSTLGPGGQVHPNQNGAGHLVGLIEQMVTTCIPMDGVEFTTQPGTPIRIYVDDHAWHDVTKMLMDKYK